VIHPAAIPRAANHRVLIRPVAVPLEAAIQANRANPTVSPIAVRRRAADQAQVAIPPRVAQAAIHRVVRQVNRHQVFRIPSLRAATRPCPHPAVPIANPATLPLPALMTQVPKIQSHPNRTVCLVYRAAILHRANPIPVIPIQAILNRVNQNQAIQNRHRVNRPARVDRRRIRAIQRQATQVDRAQAIAIRAAVIPAIAIPQVPIANPKAIPKANHIPAADRSVLASLNLRVIAGVNRKANQNRRAALIANRIRVAIPTVLADPATPAAVQRVRANQVAQVLLKALRRVLANRPAVANRRAKAKIQVAIGHRIAPAMIRVIATQQVITRQAVHPTATQIAHPTAIPIHSHRTPIHPIRTTHQNPTVAGQAPPDRSHQANHRQEVPAAVATALGSGHAAGNCWIPTVKAQNHPRAPAATTAQ
jgi:hypothetical protein